HISAGEPVNTYEKEESAEYPEDVISLSGKIMADGMVIYSGNGDGTINLYAVPSHWQEGIEPDGMTMKERSEERRVGKERRSKRDWSSDVCSSDLPYFCGRTRQ